MCGIYIYIGMNGLDTQYEKVLKQFEAAANDAKSDNALLKPLKDAIKLIKTLVEEQKTVNTKVSTLSTLLSQNKDRLDTFLDKNLEFEGSVRVLQKELENARSEIETYKPKAAIAPVFVKSQENEALPKAPQKLDPLVVTKQSSGIKRPLPTLKDRQTQAIVKQVAVITDARKKQESEGRLPVYSSKLAPITSAQAKSVTGVQKSGGAGCGKQEQKVIAMQYIQFSGAQNNNSQLNQRVTAQLNRKGQSTSTAQQNNQVQNRYTGTGQEILEKYRGKQAVGGFGRRVNRGGR